MSTFVLVHGAWHGGWCWQRLVEVLEERGHHCVAPDLPTGPSDGIEACVQAVLAAVPANATDVVLVGHSLAGLVVPEVAERTPVARLVILSGFLSAPGESMNEVVRRDGDVFSDGWPDLARRQHRHDDGSSSWPPDAAIDAFFHDAEPDDAAWAASQLRRQAWPVFDEPSPLRRMPEAPVSYILCRDDRVVNPSWSRRAVLEQLGVEPVELDGGHSPFLTRPTQLADVLLR